MRKMMSLMSKNNMNYKKIITLTIAIFISSLVVAQTQTIEDIQIVDSNGNAYKASSVEAYTSFSVGDSAPSQKELISTIRQDVNQMRDSGKYSFVDAQLIINESGLVILYQVEQKNRLRQIEIRGSNKLGNKKVREKSELKIGALVDDVDFEMAIDKIEEAYQNFWYPNVKILWSANIDRELGVVDLIIEVNEGVKTGIKKIRFVGNHTFEDSYLKRVIRQKQKSWLSIFNDAGRYHPEFLDSDLFSLKSLYMNNGFLDIQIAEANLDNSDPENSVMTFQIDEGRRYQISSFSVSGVEKVDKLILEKRIHLSSGQIASYESINNGSELIRSYFGNRGFVNTKVDVVKDADVLKGLLRINYIINIGQKGTIANINITGNERTLDKVIRRELVVEPGEDYNRSRISASENRLRNLNYFETVSITPVASSVANEYNLSVKLKEKPTGQFNAGVGVSSVDSLVGFIQLSQGNFNLKSWPPVGAGQKFQVRAQLGTRRNDLDISFTEPWFMDQKLSFGLNLYHRESRYFSDVYDQKTDGIRFSLGQPLRRNTRHSLGYSFEQFEVLDVADSASQAIKDEEGKRLASSLDYTLSYDSRDRFFNATRGSKMLFKPYLSGGLLGAETDIYGLQVKTTHYVPLIWDMIFVSRFQFESVDTFGDTSQVPIFDRQFLGGSYTLRGYEYREVGPRETEVYGLGYNNKKDSIGGNSYVFASTEITMPLWDNVRGAIFYDWGFVNYESWDFDPIKYNDNYGIGIRLQMPGFPLQLDYAWPVTYHEDRGETGKPRFNFLMGHAY